MIEGYACPADTNMQPGVVETKAAVSAGVASSEALAASRQGAARQFMETVAGPGADGYEVRTGER
jgi:hypothetical protein